MNLSEIAPRYWEHVKSNAAISQSRFEYFEAPALAPPLPPEQDPTVIIAHRFLNRGRYGLIAGPSNIGKSVLAYHLCLGWSKGREVLGFRPVRPVRVLYLQCEMSASKSAEVLWDLAGEGQERWSQDEMIVAKLAMPLQNDALLALLDETLMEYPRDLLVLDPLFGAVSLDLADQQQSSSFFRSQLPGLLIEHNLAGLVVHHCKKSVPEGLDETNLVLRETVHGSADILNAAQSGIIMRNVPGIRGMLQVRAMKEGYELGWLDEAGYPVDQRYVANGWYDIQPGERATYQFRDATGMEIQRIEQSTGRHTPGTRKPGYTAGWKVKDQEPDPPNPVEADVRAMLEDGPVPIAEIAKRIGPERRNTLETFLCGNLPSDLDRELIAGRICLTLKPQQEQTELPI